MSIHLVSFCSWSNQHANKMDRYCSYYRCPNCFRTFSTTSMEPIGMDNCKNCRTCVHPFEVQKNYAVAKYREKFNCSYCKFEWSAVIVHLYFVLKIVRDATLPSFRIFRNSSNGKITLNRLIS
ncbi:uncharacterized protein LOC129567257 [Sitodiplosis mosellana]|uniref:uncharacterized protein LOC129567257 n=1 Tax=Sitodiplosis mosellana TaxID=263140 RepID=UPI002443F5C1|nr:uncharacterized protein LOC129567257 [Sitodiplosis mosellana]